MQRTPLSFRLPASSLSTGLWMALVAGGAGMAEAAPYVEFDFARSVVCREITPAPCAEPMVNERHVEMVLPVSVRFRGLTMDDVEELDIEINSAGTGLQVFDFSPNTQLASDIAQQIETTSTKKRERSLAATLGGELPVPYGDFVAHVSPSINAGMGGSEIATEKMNRLPPKQAIVVSGTSSEGRGVFFKLKRSTQTSLEGVHRLTVTFAVPARWRGSEVRVACNAHGRRKVLWMKQPAVIGGEVGTVYLHLAGTSPVHAVAKPVVDEPQRSYNPVSILTATAAEVFDFVDGPDAAAMRKTAD